MEDNNFDFWKNVKKILREKKITQKELAEKIDVSFGTLQNQITRNILPNIETAYAIAYAIDTPLEILSNQEFPVYDYQYADMFFEKIQDTAKHLKAIAENLENFGSDYLIYRQKQGKKK